VIPYLALSGADPEALARGEGDGEARRAEASGPKDRNGGEALGEGGSQPSSSPARGSG